jgi:Protein of unknown function (DUF3052)
VYSITRAATEQFPRLRLGMTTFPRTFTLLAMKTAGYSGTPLPKKLGIKPEGRSLLVGAPKEIATELGLPKRNSGHDPLDFVLLFVKTEAELKRNFVQLMRKLQPAGMLWVCWPKKASGVATDVTETVVREFGLNAGLVDVKICAIDETWSGLKFVYRLKDRPKK